MPDKVVLTIDVTPGEHQRLEKRARQRGYQATGDYVRALIESDLEDDADQAYFWTKEWQAGEREADEDIAAGRVETFNTMDDLIADLMDDDE
jgi:hypothetical protein